MAADAPTSPNLRELICAVAQARSCDEILVLHVPPGNPGEAESQAWSILPPWE